MTSSAGSLSGSVNGKKQNYVYPNNHLAVAGGEPGIARLWATRKVGELLEQIRLSGPEKEIVDAIVDLSLQYGIVTPYTAYLVLEDEARRGALRRALHWPGSTRKREGGKGSES